MGMRSVQNPLKVHVRNSSEQEMIDESNLLGFFALLYQVDIENKERSKTMETKNLRNDIS